MPIDLNQPRVVAAIIGGGVAAVVSIAVAVINQLSLRSLHNRRVAFDREQAEGRTKAEIALAEKRIVLDYDLDMKKRRATLAEEVLADFYEAREIIQAVRSPANFSSEGSERQKAEWEKEDDTVTLNGYYATLERLDKRSEFFARFYARRYRFLANFGHEAAQPYDEFHQIYSEIVVAARMLMQTHRQYAIQNPRDIASLERSKERWEETIWWGLPEEDRLLGRLDSLVVAVETTCRVAIGELGSR